MPKVETAKFSRTQIQLHWWTASLVIAIFVTHGVMADLVDDGFDAIAADAVRFWTVQFHIWGGTVVLVLACWRLILRAKYGVPPPPPGELPLLRGAAKVTHFMLYVVIILSPVSGLAELYLGWSWAGALHTLISEPLLIALFLLHVGAALWHHFFLKSDVLSRMTRTGR